MGRAEVLQGVRQMRFEGLLERHERGELSQGEAAEMLGLSERTFRRWRDRLRDEGPQGLRDRRGGEPAGGGRGDPAHAGIVRGALQRLHGEAFSRAVAQAASLLARLHGDPAGAARRGVGAPGAAALGASQEAAAAANGGDDAASGSSRFAWLPGNDRQYDLVVTLDDATSAVYSGFLAAEEGTASSFRALAEVIAEHGLFCELYTDRDSHYFHTPKAGEPVSKTVRTQVGRALQQLGIEHIAAYSPQARGRSERAFRTLQDRLPKELALAGITTIDAANRWLAETYIPEYNAAFAVPAEQEGSAFVTDRTGRVRDILCIQEGRRSATTRPSNCAVSSCRSRRARSGRILRAP